MLSKKRLFSLSLSPFLSLSLAFPLPTLLALSPAAAPARPLLLPPDSGRLSSQAAPLPSIHRKFSYHPNAKNATVAAAATAAANYTGPSGPDISQEELGDMVSTLSLLPAPSLADAPALSAGPAGRASPRRSTPLHPVSPAPTTHPQALRMLSELGKETFLLTSKFVVTVAHNIIAFPEKKLYRKMKTNSQVRGAVGEARVAGPCGRWARRGSRAPVVRRRAPHPDGLVILVTAAASRRWQPRCKRAAC